jgi:hypothetical protein
METPEELYVNGMKRRFRNYFAAWPPNESFKLGDVGVLDGNIFIRIKSLEAADINIGFTERPDPDPSSMDVISESGVSLVVKAAGEVNKIALPNIPKGEAGLGIEFTGSGAFILKAPATYMPSIEDIDKLGKEIIEAFRRGRWNINWVVIVRIVKAPTASIIVSRSSRSKIELSATGDLGSGPVDLGNANLTFNLRSLSGDIFQTIGATNLTPLFQLARIKKRFFKGEELEILKRSRRIVPTDLVAPATSQDDSTLSFDMIDDSDLKP